MIACGGGGGGGVGGGQGALESQPVPDAEPGSVYTFSGVVRVTGSTPYVRVTIESESTGFEVRGGYRSELLHLDGAAVRASGQLVAGLYLVEEYEILEIAGHTPVVGVLELGEGGSFVRTAAGVPVELTGAPDELLGQAGAKVWVILDASGTVKGYGVIRERR